MSPLDEGYSTLCSGSKVHQQFYLHIPGFLWIKDTFPCVKKFKFCLYIPDFFWMKDSVPEVKYT